MPPFILSALALLARAAVSARGLAFGTPARAALTGVGIGSLLPGGGSLGIPGIDLFPDGGGRRRRRRRRRALTASDRADIAFIAGLLGTTAGKNFALTIATRTG